MHLEEPNNFGQFITNEIFIFIFENFIQHMFEKYLSNPTFFITFDYIVKKLLNDV